MSNSKKYGPWLITEKIDHDHGNVFMARNEGTDQIGVLKLAKTQELEEEFKTEIKTTLEVQDHPYIVKVLDHDIEAPWMVTKFYKGGTLDFQSYGAMTPQEQNNCFLFVMYAVLHLLYQGLVYEDFTENIFLDDDGVTPIVGDLECSRPVYSPQDPITTLIALGVFFNMLLNNPEISIPEFESYVTQALLNTVPEDYANMKL